MISSSPVIAATAAPPPSALVEAMVDLSLPLSATTAGGDVLGADGAAAEPALLDREQQVAAAVVVVAAAAAVAQVAAAQVAVVAAASSSLPPPLPEEHQHAAAAAALLPLVRLAHDLNGANASSSLTPSRFSRSSSSPAMLALQEASVAPSPKDESDDTEDQPLLSILREHGIPMQSEAAIDDPACLKHVLGCVDALLAACATCDNDGGRAPGFWTVDNTNAHSHRWVDAEGVAGLPYQCCSTLDADDTALPVPTVACAKRAFAWVRRVVQLRLDCLLDTDGRKDGFSPASSCCCISNWDFLKGQHALPHLINQAFEQMMVEEASRALRTALDGPALERWNDSYRFPNNVTRTPQLHYHAATPVSISASRDEYVSTFCRAALASRNTIQIATCYIFWDDPAQRYVLLDLLPYLVRTRGVKVELLLDLLVVESFTFRSALRMPEQTKEAADAPGSVTPSSLAATSFWDHLPLDRPEPSHREFASASHFLQALVDLSHRHPNHWQVRFWCARDQQERFRIKSHVKCAVFDRQLAFIGGSNITPTVKSATSDLDALLAGPAAAAVGDSFDRLWRAMNPAPESKMPLPPPPAPTTVNPQLTELTRSRYWDDPDARVAILPSTPSSDGDDVILRVVLEQIRSAQSEVVMCMGHSSYCQPVVEALAETAHRGVVVKLLVNSMYSNDLRNGQVDLFVSLRHLLEVAPSVEVYATLMPHLRDPTLGSHSRRPEFVHAKYVVVDQCWSATGSWNLWTRSAFHEIEHEAFVESRLVANRLRRKLEQDLRDYAVRISAEHCNPGGLFCPTGCPVCDGFGPFFPPPATEVV